MKKALFLLTSTLLFCSVSTYAAPFTDEQETRIKELIKQTMISNPDILEDSAKALQEKHEKIQADTMKQLLIDNTQALYNDSGSPMVGNADAPVKIVYFTDYNCPYCKQFDPQLLQLTAKYPQIAVIIKTLPFLGEASKSAAQYISSIWDNQPQKFTQVHHALMTKKSRLDEASLKEILVKNGLNNYVISDKGQAAVERNLDLSRKLGIRGTPATIIGTEVISGALPIEKIEAAIRQEIEKIAQ